MILGRVAGQIHSTINHPFYDGHKILLVDRITPQGNTFGDTIIAVDWVSSGVGDTVLMIDEGNSARQILDAPNAPIRSLIVGVVDAIHLEVQ